jgi:hypothetical protein
MHRGLRGSSLAIVSLALFVGAACSRSSSPPAPSITSPADSVHPASIAPAASPAASAIAGTFGAACVTDDDCGTHVCFHKRVKQPDAGRERRGDDGPVEHDGYCSMKCQRDEECPVPPTKGKCGARGMCKRAE